jgi:hypothetical protein
MALIMNLMLHNMTMALIMNLTLPATGTPYELVTFDRPTTQLSIT